MELLYFVERCGVMAKINRIKVEALSDGNLGVLLV